jgi:hypothetical protein
MPTLKEKQLGTVVDKLSTTRYPYILASGCSFTSDGPGGLPPNEVNPDGGCSFIDAGEFETAIPKSWAGILAKQMQCKSFLNLASSSHGNILVAMSLIETLTRYPAYQPSNTLVVFNLTDPARLDTACAHNHPDCSTRISWSKEILPLAFLCPDSKTNNSIRKNVGIDQIEIMSQHAVLSLLNFLEQKKFNYRFIMMRNYLKHAGMANVLKDYQHNLITLPGVGMEEYCIMNNLTISKHDTHPNQQGHTAIAEIVYNTL